MLSQWRLVTELSTVQERFGDRDIKAKSVSHTVFVRWITVVSCYSGNSVLAVLCCSECHSKGTSYSNLSRGHLHPTDVFLSLLLPNKNRVFFSFNILGSVHRESDLITVQQDATYSVYCISVGSSTCFGCWHSSSGACTTVITASGID